MKLLASSPAERRRQVLLLGVLAAAMAVAYWVMQPAAVPVDASGPATARPEPSGPLPVPDLVRLARLDDVPMLSEAGRNPFAFGLRPAPPAPPPQFRPTAPLPSTPSVPMTPAPPAGPPPIGLKLTGMTVAVAGGRTMVTLKDPATNTVHVAHEGDVVDGRYKIVKVGQTSVVVSYVDGSGVRTLPLGG
jgi:hypothetical protein